MSGLDWLDDMKIRVSWGQTGNQSGVGDYAFLQKIQGYPSGVVQGG